MHLSAQQNCRAFFDIYAGCFSTGESVRVLEIGSKDVNGSLRSVAPAQFEYLGVDFVAGNGVDVVLTDPYQLPLEDASVDIVLSSSCFEHSEMFWLTFLEIMRVLKPKGLCYLNVPSNGPFHRFPVDCWRFYPDSGQALVTWARHNGIDAVLLESYISPQVGIQFEGGEWNDFVAVFAKSEKFLSHFPARIVSIKDDVSNAMVSGSVEIINPVVDTEDQRRLTALTRILAKLHKSS